MKWRFPIIAKKTVFAIIFVYLVGYMGIFYILKFYRGKPFLGSSFWILRQALALALYCFIQFKPVELRVKKPMYVGVICVVFIAFVVSFMGLTFGEAFWKWNYEPFVEYAVFSMVFMGLFNRKVKSEIKCLILTMMLLSIVGYMYEIPIYYVSVHEKVGLLFHKSYPFIVHSRLFMGAILLKTIGLRVFRERIVLTSFLLWLAFSVFYGFYWKVFPQWLPRLPTLLFWLVPLVKMRRMRK